jgi:phosphonate transport system ATP-binding protein
VDRLSGGQQQRVAVGRALFRGQAGRFWATNRCPRWMNTRRATSPSLITAAHDTVVLALHDTALALAAVASASSACRAGKSCWTRRRPLR